MSIRRPELRADIARRWFAPFDASFGAGATALLAAVIAVAAGGLLVQSVFVGSLDPAALPAFNTVLALVLIAGVPTGAAQIVVVLRATPSRGHSSWRSETPRLAVAGALFGGLLAVYSFVRLDELGTSRATLAPLLVVFTALSAALVVPRGLLLARGRYSAIAIAGISGTVARVLLALAAVQLGAGVIGAMVVLIAGASVSFAVLVRAVGAEPVDGRAPLTIPWSDYVRPVLSFAGLALLIGVQAMLARHYLGSGADDEFRAATDLAQTALLIPQAMLVVSMAAFARGGVAGLDSLKLALRTAAIGALIVTALLTVGAGTGARYILGHAGSVPSGIVLLVAGASTLVGLMYLLVTYDLMRGRSNLGTIWFAVGITITIAVLMHGSAATLAITFLLVVVAALARMLAGPALVGPAATWSGQERRRVWSSPEDLDLTVVIPFYNPGGEKLRANVLTLVDELRAEGDSFEIVAVSDGSTDGSEGLVADLEAIGVRTMVLERNQGKGAALRAGLTVARGHYLGFIDADGDIPPAQWHHFLGLMRMYEADMVVGSKRHPLSRVSYPPLRRVYSTIYQHLVHALFRIDVADTQTGIKLFRRDVLADVLPLVVERGFVFDLELLVVARRRGWRRVLEAPVTIEHQFTSTISTRSVRRMLVQTAWLAVRMHVFRAYQAADGPEREASVDTLTGSPA